MTRLLLLALVLANLIAFTSWRGLLDAWLPGASEPERLGAQIAPERLTVLPATSPPAGPAPPAPAPGTSAADTTDTPVAARTPPADATSPAGTALPTAGTTPGESVAVAPLAGSVAAASTAGAPAAATACLEVGPLDEARAEKLRDWARTLVAGLGASLDKRPENVSFMVYLPPSASGAEAQRRMEQLKQAKVADLFLIGEGPLRLAISLGIFRSQEGAKSHVQALAAKGITEVRINPMPGKVERLWARLSRGTGVADSAWEDARAQLQSLAGLTAQACPAG